MGGAPFYIVANSGAGFHPLPTGRFRTGRLTARFSFSGIGP